MTASVHEIRNRAVKVAGLCRALDQFAAYQGAPVRAADVLKWTDVSWSLLAMIARVTVPSVTTRTAVLDRLVERDNAVAASNAKRTVSR
jgi:hypothetical protein